MAKFLIVTPSYNQARFLGQTIQSIRQQKANNLVYWVMDGGSSDGSAALLRKWQQKWPKFQFVSKKDKGQTAAINQGIKKLKKELASSPRVRSARLAPNIFAYINSDDYYLPGAFKKVTAAFAAHPEKAWVVGDAVIVDEDGQPIQSLIQHYKKVLRGLQLPGLLHVLNPYPQPAVFIRWSALQKVGWFDQDLRYTMDYDYWQRLFQLCGAPVLIDEPLAAFRIHSLSKGGSQYPRQFAEQLQVARRYTTNPLLLTAQQLHNWLILSMYRFLK